LKHTEEIIIVQTENKHQLITLQIEKVIESINDWYKEINSTKEQYAQT
jgi:hypothetical protein